MSATRDKRAIRSYVIREGRMTPGQKRALETAWPNYGLEISDHPIDLTKIFPAGRIVCEIGFGMGDSLLQMAQENPDTNYIGIEVHRPGVGHLLNRAADLGLSNLRVFIDDSIDVLNSAFGPDSLDMIQIFFPDPWHKKKHHKRRLINPNFAALLATRLKPKGIVHIATDWQDYATNIQEVFAGWQPVVVPARVETKYERRGKRLAHEVFDFAFEPATG